MKILLPFLLLLFTIPVFSQAHDPGTNADLKGLTKVFLDTGNDTDSRNRITSAIEKAKLGLRFVSVIEEAEIRITFSSEIIETVVRPGKPAENNPYVLKPAPPKDVTTPLIHGGGTVIVMRPGAKPRLVLSLKNSQQSPFEKRPSSKFVKAFIAAYKAGNNLR